MKVAGPKVTKWTSTLGPFGPFSLVYNIPYIIFNFLNSSRVALLFGPDILNVAPENPTNPISRYLEVANDIIVLNFGIQFRDTHLIWTRG